MFSVVVHPLVNGSDVNLKSIGKHIVAHTWHCRDTHDIDESSSDLLERFGRCSVGGKPITIVLYLFTAVIRLLISSPEMTSSADGRWPKLSLYMLPLFVKTNLSPLIFVSPFLAAYFCCISNSFLRFYHCSSGWWLAILMGDILLWSTQIFFITISLYILPANWIHTGLEHFLLASLSPILYRALICMFPTDSLSISSSFSKMFYINFARFLSFPFS